MNPTLSRARPAKPDRLSGVCLRWFAERTSHGLSNQQPPRITRRPQSPRLASSHAEPPVGSPS